MWRLRDCLTKEKTKMKKLLSILTVCGFVLAASAQNHVSQSFLNATSVSVSNLFQVTNLLAFNAHGGTNRFATYFTNLNGVYSAATNYNNGPALAGLNLLKDANLWTDRNGNYWPNGFNTFHQLSTNVVVNPINLLLRVHGGAGANSTVTFLFAPVWDETGPDATDTYATTADHWSVAVTAAGTTPVILATNVPVWRWPGAKGLRLERIVNADTDADSLVWVTRCKLNGFRP